MNHKIAIYAGTFDPITFGHLDIIKRTSVIFHSLIVAIAASTRKDTLFNLQQRIKITQHELKFLNNVKVMSFDGLLVDFAVSQNAKILIRGLRAVSDFEYEFKMAYMNNKLNAEVETIFLPATEKGHFIASSFVKEVAKFGGSLDSLVSDYVADEIKRIIKKS